MDDNHVRGAGWVPDVPPRRVALDKKTQARRIAAARELRGLDRKGLSKLFEAEGWGRQDIAALERAEDRLTLTQPRWETLARLLDVPTYWFTAEDDDLFERPATQLDRIEAMLQRVERLVSLLGAEAPTPAPPGEPGQPGQDAQTNAPTDLSEHRKEQGAGEGGDG